MAGRSTQSLDILRISALVVIVAIGSLCIGATWYVLSRLLEHRFGYGVLAPELVPFLWPLLLPAVLGGLGWRRSGARGIWAFPYIVGAVALSIAGAGLAFILLCEMGVACM